MGLVFFIQPANLCLLISVCCPLTFKVIVHTGDFTSAILLLILCVSYVFVPFFSDKLIKWFFYYSFFLPPFRVVASCTALSGATPEVVIHPLGWMPLPARHPGTSPWAVPPAPLLPLCCCGLWLPSAPW